MSGHWSDMDAGVYPSAAALDASFARDAEIRCARPVTPSTSETLTRCGACGHWGRRTRTLCRACGIAA